MSTTLIYCGAVDAGPGTDATDIDETQPADGGPSSDGSASAYPDGGFATVIRLGSNDECLPVALPTSSSGMTTCTIVITGLTDGCSAAGLSPATPQEIAAIAQKGPYSAGSACELNQLARSAGAPGCSDPQSTGWCYVQGSCLGDAGPACQRDICTTAAFNGGYFPAALDSGTVSTSWVAYLICP